MLLNPKLTLNRLFLRIVFLGTVALIVIGALLVHHEQQKAARQWQSDTISESASLTSSYYQILNTKLLMGQEKGVARLLQGVKREERLISASIIPPEQLDRSALETCNVDYTHAYFLQVPTCYEVVGDTLKVYHELRSIGYSLGYLLKEIKMPPLMFWKTSSMVWHVGCVLCVFIFVMMLVLFYIKKYLIQPLDNIGEALKDYAHLSDNPMTLKVDELQVIFESLKRSVQSISEYERKIQKYEYDAKIWKVTTQVAHDIRSPLSSLKAAAEMLRGHVAGNGDAMDAVNLLQLSSNRLEGIADGLLAKHRGIGTELQVFSIHEVFDELIGEFQASPLGKGITFKKQYHADALYISGDKMGMTRAVGNIIKNALEAMSGNGVEKPKALTVSTVCHCEPQAKQSSETNEIATAPSEPRNDMVIRITDTGPGIAAEKIPLILKGGHTEGKENGNGIGTKVLRDVIEAHNGQISIESEVGKGSTFVVTLPLSETSKSAVTEMTVTLPYAGVGPICVIDDEPSMREQWRLALKAQGVVANVYTCWEDYSARHRGEAEGRRGDPECANEIAATPSESRNDTFIIDYHFDNSEVDGVEVVRRLKGRGFTNLVLATAEYWKPAIKAATSELGITLCPKPLPQVVLACHPDSHCHSEASLKDLDSSGVKLSQFDNINGIATSLHAAPCNAIDGPSILLIDDDPDIHMCWKMMRKVLGVGEMAVHKNLEEMIAAATNPAQFDLCVIDKNIEGSQFDGARTLEYLRQNGARTVILATGDTADDIRKDPRFNSADGILKNKVPMTPEDLDPFLN